MKILLTGRKGFIGKNFEERIKLIYPELNLISIARDDCDLSKADAFLELVSKHKPDSIIHTAISLNDYANNLSMYYSLEAVHHLCDRIVILGSGCEYNPSRYKPLMKEEYFDQYKPPTIDNIYIHSRFTISRLHQKSDIDNIYNLRLFGVYGAHEDYSRRLISNSIYQLLTTGSIRYRRDIKFDYLYVDDLLDAVVCFIKSTSPKFNNYNVCSGFSTSFSTIMEAICSYYKCDPSIITLDDHTPSDYEYSGSSQRFESEFKHIISSSSLPQSIDKLNQWMQITINHENS